MIFLYPLFLFGLLALSIPIIIHLFNFKKTRRIYFSYNQFLKNVKEASSAKLKLKHILILAARMLFLAFLVLAFAQPFIPSSQEDLNNQSVYIYLDNSYSMSNKVNNEQSLLDLAVNYVNEILNLYPANSQFIFLTNEFSSFSNTKKSPEQIKEHITEIDYSTISRSLPEVLNRLRRVDDYTMEKGDVFIISDFQKSTLGPIDGLGIDSIHNFSFIPLSPSQTQNVFIDSVYLTKPFLFAGQKNQLEASLYNTSGEGIQDLIVKLFINEVQVANTSINIAAQGNNVLQFDIAPGLLQKNNQCRINFEEFPVTFDNEFYFALNTAERISILEIKSTLAGANIEKVYANPDVFIFSSYNVNNVDYGKINQADLIVINNLSEVSSSLSNSLKSYIQNGGHILIVPSENINPSSFESLVDNIRFSSNQSTDRKNIAPPDFANPFYENVFEETNVVMDMPEARRTLKWSSNASSLLNFNNGEPFLSEISDVGRVYLLGSPLHNSFTNFHKHAIFVPVMYKIAAMSKSMNDRLYFSVNEPVLSIRMDTVAANDVYKLENKDQQLIPNQRTRGTNLILEVPKNILQSGYYNLVQKDQIQKTIAFNFDKSESLLETYNEDELKNLFAANENVKLFNADNVSQFTKEMKEAHFGISLWEYAIILALFFLLCEILFLRFL
ncbi:MAG: BatA domain-containing protein [Bacteroidota bacterium]|nr:BatA domain-containing protein [Bacteroidota bacterium]